VILFLAGLELAAAVNGESYSRADEPALEIQRSSYNKELSAESELEPDEEARLLAACHKSKNKELRSIVVIALESGLRRSELLGLT